MERLGGLLWDGLLDEKRKDGKILNSKKDGEMTDGRHRKRKSINKKVAPTARDIGMLTMMVLYTIVDIVVEGTAQAVEKTVSLVVVV